MAMAATPTTSAMAAANSDSLPALMPPADRRGISAPASASSPVPLSTASSVLDLSVMKAKPALVGHAAKDSVTDSEVKRPD